MQDQPERIDIRTLIGRNASRLLRGHVFDGAHHRARRGHSRDRGAFSRAGDAKIHDQRMVLGVHHDVGRLQVAMYDPGLVRRGESRCHLPGDHEHAIDRQPSLALQDRGEVRSLDVRHRDVQDVVDVTEIVDADNVGVRDLAREQQLAFEALFEGSGRLLVQRGVGPHDLDGHGDLEHLVPGLVHRAHAAGAEQADDVVARAEILADGER